MSDANIQTLKTLLPLINADGGFSRETRNEIGKAFEVSISALEKQIPKKPKYMMLRPDECSVCGERIFHRDRSPFCHICGQAIDWSE